jgi:hypothetical protein
MFSFYKIFSQNMNIYDVKISIREYRMGKSKMDNPEKLAM